MSISPLNQSDFLTATVKHVKAERSTTETRLQSTEFSPTSGASTRANICNLTNLTTLGK